MTADQLKRFFEEPGAHLLLDLNYIILDAGPEYLRTTYTKREDIVGKSVLTIVDDSTHKEYNGSLRASLERVVETRQPDKMDTQRYDVLKHTGEGEKTEHTARWLRVTNIPIFAGDEMTGIVQRIEDVTLEHVTARRLAGLRREVRVFYAVVLLIVVGFAYGLSVAINQNKSAIRQTRESLRQSKQAIAATRANVHSIHSATINAQAAIQQSQAAIAETKAQSATSCHVQARGLRVGHELLGVIEGLHAILTLPVSKDQSRQRSRLPRALLKRELKIFRDLNGHLDRYTALEKKQPQSRTCP